MEEVVSKNQPITSIGVKGGMEDSLQLYAKEAILFPVANGDIPVRKLMRCPSVIDAPVEEGQAAGKLLIFYGGRKIASTELIAGKSVAEKDFMYFLNELLAGFAA